MLDLKMNKDAILLSSMVTALSTFVSQLYKTAVRFFIHHKTYTAFIFVMIVSTLLYTLVSTPKVTGETYTVTLNPIKQYVRVSGQVTSSKDANLSFQTSGATAYIGVTTGDTVEQGKVLATLVGGDAQASLLQAEGSLSNAEAVLAQLKQGARKEEIALKEQAVQNAKSSLDQAYSSLPDAIQNVDAVTADVVKNKFSDFFVLNNGRYQLSFSSCDQRLQGVIEEERTVLENTLALFQKKSSVITTLSSTDNIDATFEAAYNAALSTNEIVNSVSNLLLSSCSSGNPSLAGFRLTLSTVKTTMTTLFSDIAAKRGALVSAKNNFTLASRDLDLIKAGTDPYKIKAQAAVVEQAEAQVKAAKAGLAKTIIVAPFFGIISNVDLSLGETVTVGKTVISMLAVDGYEIEAKVPEIDIIKIKVGATVDVTLDAYGRDVIFPATVTRINPTATTEGTVPVYKVIVTFVGKDARIKQGMTANIQIVTESKSNVVAVPARFVRIVSSNKGEVTVLVANKEVVREIGLGIRGADGLFEVTSGLVGGEKLVAPSTISREAQKQTS